MDAQGIHQWDEIYPSRTTLQTDIEKQYLAVMEVDGQIAGMIVINSEESPEYQTIHWQHLGKVLVIHRLTIDPSFQRRGLASRLMEFAEQTAEMQGCDTIRLDVFQQNPGAIALYERLGYTKAGVVQFRKGLFFCMEKVVKHR